jgi:hypothetical protein
MYSIIKVLDWFNTVISVWLIERVQLLQHQIAVIAIAHSKFDDDRVRMQE